MSKLRPKEKKKVTVRGNDFRYIPSDYFNVAMSEDGMKLILGVEEVSGEATELVGAHLSHRSAYGLMLLLKEALEHAREEFDFVLEDPEIIEVEDDSH